MSRLADIDKLEAYFKKIANEWADGYKDINLEELSESDKKVASALANYMIRTVVIIDEWPTVDAVEIVRCEECKWRGEYFSCPFPYRTEDDFFCGKGESNE